MTTTPEITREIQGSVAPGTESSSKATAAAPILITEQEVALSTAAALPLRPTKVRRWAAASSAVLAALRRMSEALTTDVREPQRHYPKRYAFLERSCMAREMERL